MSFFKTLRARFALWTAGLLLIALLLFGLFVYGYMARSLRANVDDALHSAATQLIDEGLRGELLILDDLVEDPQYVQLNEQGLSVRLLSLEGKPLQSYGPYTTWPSPAPATLASEGELTTLVDAPSRDTVRIFTIPVIKRGERLSTLQIALTLSEVQRTMKLLLVALLVGVPIIVFLAGSGGYFLAATALAPIDKVTHTARQISAKELSARLNLPETDDEVGRLVATFDSMLARLDEAFRRERQFTSDASHELRTPLTAMRTIVSSTLTRQRTPKEYEQALMDLGDEVEQMRSLTEGLLLLARTDHQLKQLEALDLTLLLKDVIDSLRPLAEDKGLQLLDALPADTMMVEGNRDGLIRLFVNLLDNAIKYTAQGTITVSAEQPNLQSVAVMVQDSGIGIAAEHLPHIFERFYRADSSRSSEGIGLGLAIVRDIVRLHKGEISVQSEPGKGTTFTVMLPVRLT